MTQNATVKKKTNKQNEIYKMIIIAQFIHEVYWYIFSGKASPKEIAQSTDIS